MATGVPASVETGRPASVETGVPASVETGVPEVVRSSPCMAPPALRVSRSMAADGSGRQPDSRIGRRPGVSATIAPSQSVGAGQPSSCGARRAVPTAQARKQAAPAEVVTLAAAWSTSDVLEPTT